MRFLRLLLLYPHMQVKNDGTSCAIQSISNRDATPIFQVSRNTAAITSTKDITQELIKGSCTILLLTSDSIIAALACAHLYRERLVGVVRLRVRDGLRFGHHRVSHGRQDERHD